jgi:hypothetical protein
MKTKIHCLRKSPGHVLIYNWGPTARDAGPAQVAYADPGLREAAIRLEFAQLMAIGWFPSTLDKGEIESLHFNTSPGE